MTKTTKINFTLFVLSLGFAISLTSMLHIESGIKEEIVVELSAEEKLNETICRLLKDQSSGSYLALKTRNKDEEYYTEKQYYKAIVLFYRSKISKPSNFSARVRLAEIFTENCTKNNRYCGNAQREIKNAFAYSEYGKQSDIAKLLYLEKIMKDYAFDYFNK